MKGDCYEGEGNQGTSEVLDLISPKLLDGIHQLGFGQTGQLAIKSDRSICDGRVGLWQLPEL